MIFDQISVFMVCFVLFSVSDYIACDFLSECAQPLPCPVKGCSMWSMLKAEHGEISPFPFKVRSTRFAPQN
jgi:hypothetical protein